jgi:hypothetical protein
MYVEKEGLVFNEGFIEHIKTKYFLLTHIYDRHAPNFSKIMMEYIENNHSCDICFSNFFNYQTNKYSNYHKDDLIFKEDIFENKLPKSSILFRKNIHTLLNFNLFSQNYHHDFFFDCLYYHLNIHCANTEFLFSSIL